MSRRDIAKLAFVMAGIYALFEALPRLEAVFWWLHAQPQQFSGLGMSRAQVITAGTLPTAVLVMLALGLIVFSGHLAARMFPDEPQNPERILAVPALAYSVVGLVSLIWGLSGLGQPVFVVLSSGWQDRAIVSLTESVVLILFGPGLFFGSHGLARIWSRLRYAGLRRQMGLCLRCGYDLTGNTTGVCPECGLRQAVDADAESATKRDNTINP